jgi:hypothetical protein
MSPQCSSTGGIDKKVIFCKVNIFLTGSNRFSIEILNEIYSNAIVYPKGYFYSIFI